MKTWRYFMLAAMTAILGFSAALVACDADKKNNDTTNPALANVDSKRDKYSMRENLTTQELILEMGLGINLGNTLEACGDWIRSGNISDYETAWGSPVITEAIIEGYAKAGFSSLRIPVAWSNLMQADYTIHAALLDRVETVVNWAIDNGMTALINLHWDNGWWAKFPEDKTNCMNKYTAIWTQVSGRFKDYGDCLMFESMNEVGFDSIWNQWSGTATQKAQAFGLVNEINQKFVDVVRASGGNNAGRHLLINVYNTHLDYAFDPLFKMPDDPANRCAASVHYYTPSVFAILDRDADWGKAQTTWGTPADLAELNSNMDKLKTNCVDKGIPVIIGEFAAGGKNKAVEMRRLYAVKVAEAVYSRGMCPMLWDTPVDQYDRNTRTWRDPLFLSEIMAIPGRYPNR
jgi:endoglucanase